MIYTASGLFGDTTRSLYSIVYRDTFGLSTMGSPIPRSDNSS